ncbi:hypothetical protein CFOL_v3_31782 [Cephalotus follicularis]|uniref:Uncharacterized protein n=1 Tax=Cephalotus follicularis TaxID=3775 RepID=A0A1Q3D7D9_CEPFO|nr:hypothetical protein CFOL_v3_31782 [Cephalotus follicularis]
MVAGTAPLQTQVEMTFLVVDTPSPYNAIVGRPGLNLLEAIVSTRHLVVKFLTRFGMGEVRGDQQAVLQNCHLGQGEGQGSPHCKRGAQRRPGTRASTAC